MDLHSINTALNRMGELLEETSVIGVKITADDVDQATDECSEIFPCGELGEGDEINQFISDVIDQFAEQGMEESEAEDLVYQTMEEAIESGALEDTPDLDASEEAKREWILGFDNLLEQKLGDSN